MKSLLPANRVALILHAIFVIATVAVIFVTTLQGDLPKAWQPDVAFAVTILGGLAAATVAVYKFLGGSQNWDTITIGLPDNLGNTSLTAPPQSAITPDAPVGQGTTSVTAGNIAGSTGNTLPPDSPN
jgi:hypothetical protein